MIIFECDCCGKHGAGDYRDGTGLPHGWHVIEPEGLSPERVHHFCCLHCKEQWEKAAAYGRQMGIVDEVVLADFGPGCEP
jgi:hypothetical protein